MDDGKKQKKQNKHDNEGKPCKKEERLSKRTGLCYVPKKRSKKTKKSKFFGPCSEGQKMNKKGDCYVPKSKSKQNKLLFNKEGIRCFKGLKVNKKGECYVPKKRSKPNCSKLTKSVLIDRKNNVRDCVNKKSLLKNCEDRKKYFEKDARGTLRMHCSPYQYGSYTQVLNGTANQTSSGLISADLMKNKRGKIVSVAKHNAGLELWKSKSKEEQKKIKDLLFRNEFLRKEVLKNKTVPWLRAECERRDINHEDVSDKNKLIELLKPGEKVHFSPVRSGVKVRTLKYRKDENVVQKSMVDRIKKSKISDKKKEQMFEKAKKFAEEIKTIKTLNDDKFSKNVGLRTFIKNKKEQEPKSKSKKSRRKSKPNDVVNEAVNTVLETAKNADIPEDLSKTEVRQIVQAVEEAVNSAVTKNINVQVENEVDKITENASKQVIKAVEESSEVAKEVKEIVGKAVKKVKKAVQQPTRRSSRLAK